MIHVLHFTTDCKIAGAEKLLLGIAREHDSSRYEMHFCTLRERGEFHNGIEALGHRALSLNCSRTHEYPLALARLVKIIRKHDIDILHTHLHHASFIGQSALFFCPKTIGVMTRHYSDVLYLYGNAAQRFMDRCANRWATHIIAISNAVENLLVHVERVEESKVSRIYNGLDFSEVTPGTRRSEEIRQQFGIGVNEFVIGAVGSLHPRKGHEYLIEAFQRLCRERDDLHLIIVGDGMLRRKYLKLIKEYNLECRAHLTGFRSDAVDLVGMMDVFVQPSVEEGFGISILEAMALGKPVVATDVGGIVEIVENGRTGVIVKCKDGLMLADAIRDLLRNSERRKILGANGRESVIARFDIKNMVRQYEEVYDRMCPAALSQLEQ